jgi:hypothetical protein
VKAEALAHVRAGQLLSILAAVFGILVWGFWRQGARNGRAGIALGKDQRWGHFHMRVVSENALYVRPIAGKPRRSGWCRARRTGAEEGFQCGWARSELKRWSEGAVAATARE